MKQNYILSIDLGTTGNRAIIFNREQNIIAKAYQEFEQIFPQPGWVEHDPLEIWATTLAVIRKAIESAGIKPEEIAAAGITNQRETVMIWDKMSGLPVANAIVWQCRRTAEFCDGLKERGLEQTITEKTGLHIDAYFSASKLHWLLARFPYQDGYLCGTVDTWILWKLTNGKTHATEYSNASRTMLFNINTLQWDEELLQIFGIHRAMLPEVQASDAHFGDIDAAHFGAAIPVHGILGDQQAAMFAQGCFEPGIYKNTYGTGCFLMTNTGTKPLASKHRLLTTIAWMHAGQVEYALEGSIFIGGAAIQWLRDGLGIITDAAETATLMESLPNNEGVYFVPALAGLGAPYWDMNARGLLIGMTRGTTRAHIVRAALESLCFQTRDVLEAMGEDMSPSGETKIQLLQVDGGASANEVMMQFQADLLGADVVRPQILEITALGAAFMAGIGCGFWTDRAAVMRKRKIGKTFHPQKDKAQMDKYYKKWRAAVTRSQGWAE